MQWNTKSLVPSKLNQLCSSNIKPWNNGKEVPRLDLTSLTTPWQQVHYVRPHPDSKYNKSVWLAAVSPCRAPIGRLSPLPCLITWQLHVCYISQLLRDSFSVSQQPPSGNLLPMIPWCWYWFLGLGGREVWSLENEVHSFALQYNVWLIKYWVSVSVGIKGKVHKFNFKL